MKAQDIEAVLKEIEETQQKYADQIPLFESLKENYRNEQATQSSPEPIDTKRFNKEQKTAYYFVKSFDK